ncbi:acyl-CoA thioester hydrolase [Sphingobacterium nematocida]|uniref:Acyl-CoA thioester hydrolase n=1 Tax=Sphingobacterium nematocida TaxID=1513896 RepID=A0A1T5EQG8_9SPHI|nr:acyl-CoA thioesterase [Sphingobacterium nematocida]SKB86164.1 acyl-CoA thioester hydrolase [Sphingobacterium nematocida]
MIRRKELYNEASHLTISKWAEVRFNEVDSLGIVWHGHYITFFEDGREAFGREYGIDYLAVQAAGYTTPIVKSNCEHKLPLRYGDKFRIETSFIDTPAAKMIFKYRIFNIQDTLVCLGETTQVFLDGEGILTLNTPDFILNWKKKVGLL